VDEHTPHHPDQADTLDLRDYLAVLKRRRWVIVQTVVVVVVVAVIVTLLQTPEYESTVSLVVEPASQGDDAALQQLVFGQRELETQKELVTSRPVADAAAETLGGADVDDLLERIDVTLLRDTQILEIRATSTDPADAAATASAFAEGYLAYRSDQAIERIVAATESLQRREDQLRDRLNEIDRELRTASGSDEDALEREADRLQTELASLSATRLSLSASDDLVRGAGEIIKPAEVPESPFSPKPLRTGVLALVLGLMLGVGLAFLRDFLDDAIRSPDQAQREVGRPLLGHVPLWRAAEGETRLVSLVEPASPVAEAYRTLRTNIRFLTAGGAVRSVLVTSAVPGEGKTTTAGNLAVALARAGTRVLLVGADLRRPSIHKAFGVEAVPGLSDVLVGEAKLTDAIQDVGVPNLRVIAGGQIPPNPAELLGAPGMAQLMTELEQIADMVVYDGPPVLAVADALELAPRVGGTVLVVDVGTTGRHALRAAAERLRGVDVPVAGLVLNNLDPTDGYYGYTYYHSYSSDEAAAGAP
jgi:polysaccharide biosynthesis transport protein